MLLAALTLLTLAADTTARIREWTVPYPDSRPRDPYVAPDGRVWFVGQLGDYAAVLDPASGAFRKYDLGAGTGPHNLIVDRQGIVWFAGNKAAHIGRLDPKTGAIRRYPMPDPAAKDPHTLVFDRAGDIWFSVQGGNFVGKLTVATGQVRLVKVPVEQARPYGIVIDAGNRPWFDLFGSHRIGTVDPVTFQYRDYPLPDAKSRPRRIALTSDGAVWYSDFIKGRIGRLDPKTGAVQEWPCPYGGNALPYALTSDAQDRIWFVETGATPNRLVGFDTRTQRFIGATNIPSGAGAVRHMHVDPATGLLWFGTDNNTIGQARLPGSRSDAT